MVVKTIKKKDTQEPWVDTETVAEHIGKAPQWLRENGARVGIPRVRLGNQWRYKISEVDQWLHQNESQVGA